MNYIIIRRIVWLPLFLAASPGAFYHRLYLFHALQRSCIRAPGATTNAVWKLEAHTAYAS